MKVAWKFTVLLLATVLMSGAPAASWTAEERVKLLRAMKDCWTQQASAEDSKSAIAGGNWNAKVDGAFKKLLSIAGNAQGDLALRSAVRTEFAPIIDSEHIAHIISACYQGAFGEPLDLPRPPAAKKRAPPVVPASSTAPATRGPTWRRFVQMTEQAGHKLSVQLNRPDYRMGDELVLRITTEEEGNLVVIAVDARDVPTMLFPNGLHLDNKVGRGEVEIPGPNMGFALPSTSPGDTLLAVFLLRKPVDLCGALCTRDSPFRSWPTTSDMRGFGVAAKSPEPASPDLRSFEVVAKSLVPAAWAASVVAPGAKRP